MFTPEWAQFQHVRRGSRRLYCSRRTSDRTINGRDKDRIRPRLTSTLAEIKKRIYITSEEKLVLESLQRDTSIVIIFADKGGATVVMNQSDYNHKALTLLSDTTTYRLMDTDPTTTIERRGNKAVSEFHEMELLTDEELRTMRVPDTIVPRFYGLPKVLKDGAPLRPIVALRDAPIHNVAKVLFRRLKPLT